MILRGDPGLLVAMGDDRDVFLDWLQGSGLNAIDALVVYFNTDTNEVRATIVEKVTGEDGTSHIKATEDGEAVTRSETYFLATPDQRILGRWLGYLDMRKAEAKTLIQAPL